MYKLSKFNVAFSHNGNDYIWNTKSGAVIRLDRDGKEYIANFDEYDEKNEMLQIVLKNGFVVKKQFDEVGKIVFDECTAMYDRYPDTFYYTIAPGMNCNYFCVYCFEEGRDRKIQMSSELAGDVVKFIEKKSSMNHNLKRINIKWFGGEPLLYLDLIRLISKRVMDFCDKNSIVYDAGIITNGSLLTNDVCDELVSLHVKNAQITVDGLEKDYCKSKRTSSNNFFNTVNNIQSACEKMNISIRLNIKDNNAIDAINVSDYLLHELGLYKKIGVYFAFVRDYNRNSIKEDYQHFSNEYIKWLTYMNEKYDWIKMKKVKSFVKTTSCASIRRNNYCIGPKGELYKCEHCIGEYESAIGNINEGEYHNESECSYMETLISGKRENCLKCEFLPLCLGGCANDNVSKSPGIDCDAYKEMEVQKIIMQIEN